MFQTASAVPEPAHKTGTQSPDDKSQDSESKYTAKNDGAAGKRHLQSCVVKRVSSQSVKGARKDSENSYPDNVTKAKRVRK